MELIFILALIVLNGIFSMSEIALVSSRRVRLENAAKSGSNGAKIALELSTSPTRFLSTVQIGITLIGLLTGIYSGENITNELEGWLVQFELVRPVADGLAVTIVLISITFCSLVLGELVPKRIGLTNPEGISSRLAPFMKLLSTVTYPFVWILTHTSDVILRILGIKASKDNNITEEEIKAIIQESAQGGEIQKIEQDIVERVFALGDRKVSSLMTNRSDLVFLDIAADIATNLRAINKDLHRIYPVFEKDKDNLLGIVTLKDIFIHFQQEKLSLKEIVKSAHYLTEATSAYKALEKFKTSKVHYALVTNEYGLVLGIVTMDDILKALVGDVSEFYTDEFQLTKRDDGTWVVDGQYPLAEFLLELDLDNIGNEQINTVAGIILRELNQIPKVGEKVVWNSLEFEVIDMDKVKIDKVIVKKIG
jgi:putative hemolysin